MSYFKYRDVRYHFNAKLYCVHRHISRSSHNMYASMTIQLLNSERDTSESDLKSSAGNNALHSERDTLEPDLESSAGNSAPHSECDTSEPDLHSSAGNNALQSERDISETDLESSAGYNAPPPPLSSKGNGTSTTIEVTPDLTKGK